MPGHAARTTRGSGAAAKPKVLPPARAFAKPARAAGPALVRRGVGQTRTDRERFVLPKEYRRSSTNHGSAVRSFASPLENPARVDSIISGAEFLSALHSLPRVEAAPRYSSGVDLHPWSLPDSNTALDGESVSDFTGARQRPAAVIQFAQLPQTQVIVPPALLLHQPLGKAITTHSLQRFASTAITSSGAALPVAVRNPLAHTFSVDLSPIRVHTDAHSQQVVRSLSTRAFAYGNHIFLGPGEQPADLGLMAHEVAHVVQQSRGATLQHFTPGGGDVFEREADAASSAATRGESFTVQQRTSARPQGYGLGDLASDLGIPIPDPLDWLANKANVIPGFRMFTIVLGVNPINMSAVDRSAANILRAVIEFLPGGGLITQALENSGVFEKAGAFVEEQIASLGMTGAAIKAAVTEFIAGLSLKRIVTEPGNVWEDAKRIFTEPIDRIISFVKGLVTGIIQLIKDAILKPIAKLAEGTEGYNLLKGILGKDPITGEAVPRTAETLLGPLLKMIGLGDVWQKMQEAKAVPRAWAWFQSTMSTLVGFVSQIPGLFISAFKSLTIEDIILVPKAFAKLANVFGGFLGKFVSWGVDAMFKLLEIVFDVVSPKAFGYIKQTGSALKNILKNPLPFVGNLVKAAKLGFTNFASNILGHLKKGLIDWLTGSLEGVYIPTALSLPEFGKLAISILGVSWAQIRGKIVKALGPNGEMIMSGLEELFDVVQALISGGPAAAWEVIKDKLTGLKDTIVQGIISFVTESIVTKAVPKLIAMFIPGAGFISAIISVYDIIKTFIEKLQKIGQVIGAFVNSIVSIAAGNIGGAAAKVESVLGGLLSLAISFLAGFVGLGKVTSKIKEVINKVRTTVDKAIETAVNWIINKAKSLFARLFSSKGKDKKKGKDAKGGTVKKPFSLPKEGHTVTAKATGATLKISIASLREMEIRAMLAEAYAEVNADESRPKDEKARLLGDLSGARAAVATMGQQYDAEYRKGDLDYEPWAEIRMTGIINLLSALGADGVKAFADFKGKPLDKRYLPSSYDVRQNLYITGSGYSTNQKSVVASGSAELAADVKVIVANRKTDPAKAKKAWNNIVKKLRAPDGSTMATIDTMVPATKYHVDHEDDLAKHWQKKGGNNTGDTDRWALSNLSNLRYITEAENLRRPKGNYVNFVKKGFTSARADGNAPLAKRIDGQPFRDSNGAPI
jgi:hypothetical protein